MAALRAKFDSNGDGKLTSADAAWANFKVMVTNPNGSQTAQTLGQLGIPEINLRPDATHVMLVSEAGGGRRRGVQIWTLGKLRNSQDSVNFCSSDVRGGVHGLIRVGRPSGRAVGSKRRVRILRTTQRQDV